MGKIRIKTRSCAGPHSNERAQWVPVRLLKGLARDDGGAVLIFTLMMFLTMFVVLGMAVDVMRAESERVRIQQTLDRAVLAAADLDQPREAQDVVNDYFEKAGLEDHLTDVTITEGLNFKRVEAEAESYVPALFLDLVGMPVMLAEGAAGAEERVSDIEISLVVDISGSMGSNSRLTNLKTAANEFFDLVAADQSEETGVTSVSIIPYTGTVNAGADLLQYFDTTLWHEESHCIRFRDWDFDTVVIDPTVELERVAHFAEGSYNYYEPQWYYFHCEDEPDHAILPFETNVQAMKDHINGLSADGWTGIDNGMKWAAALLDPAVRPVVNQMISDGTHPNMIQNWPTDYGADDSMKIIVLMTDGANTNQYDILKWLKSEDIHTSNNRFSVSTVAGYKLVYDRKHDGMLPAMSPVYYSPSWGQYDSDDGYIVYIPNNGAHEGLYQPKSPYTPSDDVWHHKQDLPADGVQLSWQDLYSRYGTSDMARYFFEYSDPDGYWYTWRGYWYWAGSTPHWYDDARYPVTLHDAYSEVDDRLYDICDAVHEQKVIVFSIAFEAPIEGETVMRYCATGEGNYYDVDGTDLSYAFSSIANQINHLRLIQ